MRGQYLEIASYTKNPKTIPWMAEWLLSRYDSMCEFDLKNGTAMAAATDERIDTMLATGEVTGEPVPQSQLFELVAARSILRAHAGRSDEEIAQDDKGTNMQQQAQAAQKEALLYVSRLFNEHPNLALEWFYPQPSVD